MINDTITTQRWINACDAYWWVYNHPKMLWKECSPPNIDITPHMVCPETNRIEDDPTLNTKMQFWVECGAYVDCDMYGDGVITVIPSHDWELDCGGWTWDEAVLNLAQLILERHGDYSE